ncbi:hypothetical protein, conserved [Eimeria acervulina]|uniref:Uncharacterized protein n=1 Tax=Eimeria acervulina TaxID=5801 RepID=U6GSK6_EIMAC|nr:hypothetical protein, conserved [Eimeria acervulina]CDI81559.1 hypothetical protein, conserved [Eimeria acervulina]
MAAEALTQGAYKESACKKSPADGRPVRFSLGDPNDASNSCAGESKPARESVHFGMLDAPPTDQAIRKDSKTTARKPTVIVGADGRPLPILKGNRTFGYGQARRLVEQLRVKFAFDRNETRFYCPDSNEHTEPPPAPAELRDSVRGFLKSSKRVAQESQELTQAVQQKLNEAKEIEQELTAMTQKYVEKLEHQKAAQRAKQTVVISSTKPPRRFLCCGASPVVLQ